MSASAIDIDLRRPSSVSDAFIEALTIPQQMALAMAILERAGFCQDVAGQFVVRDPDGRGFYTNPWGFTWDCVRAGDVLLVDEQSHVVEGRTGLAPSPSLELHFGILRLRPDVNCSLHNHPPLSTAWATGSRPLLPLDQTCSLFFERQGWCAEFADVETLYDPTHFARTGPALGPDAHVLWMHHHGVIVAHRTIPFLAIYALYLERAVRLNLDAQQVPGGATALKPKVARKMRDLLQTIFVIPDTWKAVARSILRERPDLLD